MLNWKTIRESQYKAREQRLAREMPLERELPVERGGHRLYTPTAQVSAQVSDTVNPILQNGQKQQKCKMEQMEFESITEPIDQHEAFIRHKEAMARRAFAWYRLCKDPAKKMKLIDTYNRCALLGKKRDGR